MEEPERIKAFNYVVLRLFNRLYEEFPQPVTLSTRVFVEETMQQDSDAPKEVLRETLVADTIGWLASEGFVRYSHIRPGGVYHWVVLTLNGLAVLGYMPTAIGGRESPSIIAKTKEILGKGAAAGGAEVIHATVSAAFTAMMRHTGLG